MENDQSRLGHTRCTSPLVVSPNLDGFPKHKVTQRDHSTARFFVIPRMLQICLRISTYKYDDAYMLHDKHIPLHESVDCALPGCCDFCVLAAARHAGRLNVHIPFMINDHKQFLLNAVI